MKASALKYAILSGVVSLVTIILLLMPFHAFLTVWLASALGHYTALRLWIEVVFLVCGIGVLLLVAMDTKIRTHTLPRRLVQLIIFYFVVELLWGLIAYKKHDVSAKALGYGLIVDLRFPLFFLITWAVALRTNRLQANWQKLLLWPAAVVVVFGLLQVFVLPRDFLSHFGYNAQTIPPYETINHNVNYIRIASTLRGANPLGAYLLLPISALVILITSLKHNFRKLVFLAAALLALFFSYSRSAWIGALLAVLVIAGVRWHKQISALRRQVLFISAAAVIVVVCGLVVSQHSNRLQNIIFHTQRHSAVHTTSDQAHVSALRSGLSQLVHEPFGRGPGTAGPASIYNSHPPRIAENYYVEIGQETGWLGLTVFLLINVGVGYLLWLRRRDPLALTLFASLIGLCFVNLLSYAWADDTLSYVWWGLAGVAMSAAPISRKAANRR
jgi:hypothetical protein